MPACAEEVVFDESWMYAIDENFLCRVPLSHALRLSRLDWWGGKFRNACVELLGEEQQSQLAVSVPLPSVLLRQVLGCIVDVGEVKLDATRRSPAMRFRANIDHTRGRVLRGREYQQRQEKQQQWKE